MPPARTTKRKKRRNKIKFYAVSSGMGVGIYKCWSDMKHLVTGDNEKLLHEGFSTLAKAERYVATHLTEDQHCGDSASG